MTNTTDVGLAVRISGTETCPAERLAALRATLLDGRGPGASDEEVAEHTSDRPWLGAVPVAVERALVARQDAHLRAGAPIVNVGVQRRADGVSRWPAVIFGAGLALVLRSAAARLVRSPSGRRR